MVTEAIQQYKDYYESDEEEQGFFEYLDNLTNKEVANTTFWSSCDKL